MCVTIVTMPSDPLPLAVAIAGAVRARGGRALIVGGYVRDQLLGLPSKDSTSRSSGSARRTCPRCSARSAASSRSAELSRLQGRRRGRRAAPARVEERPRPQGVRRRRRPVHAGRGGGAAPRLHDQRDRLGPAHRRPTWTRSTAAAISSARRPARRRSAHVRRRQPAGAARDAVRGALRAGRAGPATRAICRAIPLDDLPAERDLGRDREAAAARRRARRSASRSRSISASSSACWPEMEALVGCQQEPRVASGGRRLDAHADGHRRGAHADRRSRRGRRGRS